MPHSGFRKFPERRSCNTYHAKIQHVMRMFDLFTIVRKPINVSESLVSLVLYNIIVICVSFLKCVVRRRRFVRRRRKFLKNVEIKVFSLKKTTVMRSGI